MQSKAGLGRGGRDLARPTQSHSGTTQSHSDTAHTHTHMGQPTFVVPSSAPLTTMVPSPRRLGQHEFTNELCPTHFFTRTPTYKEHDRQAF